MSDKAFVLQLPHEVLCLVEQFRSIRRDSNEPIILKNGRNVHISDSKEADISDLGKDIVIINTRLKL